MFCVAFQVLSKHLWGTSIKTFKADYGQWSMCKC